MNPPPFYPLRPRLKPGRVLITPEALTTLQANRVSVMSLLVRHICGDWGDVSDDDWQQNDLSVTVGLRVLSIYTMPDRTRVWIVTEWDRSATTILLPDNY